MAVPAGTDTAPDSTVILEIFQCFKGVIVGTV